MQPRNCTPELTVRQYRAPDDERVREVFERATCEGDAAVEAGGVGGMPSPRADDCELLVGTHEGSIVAVGAFQPLADRTTDGYAALLEPTAECSGIAVLPEHQHRGFGRRLCAELERRAREQGYRELVLDTDLHNDVARAFFESLGFDRETTITVDIDAGEFGLALYRKRLCG